MISKNRNSFKWVYLPVVISSAAILTSQLSAGEYQAQDAQQVQSIGHQYVGGRTRIGVSVTDDGDASADINHVFSETQNSSTSGGLWAGVELDGDDKGIDEGGVQINHNWVARDGQGNATYVNKAFAAYDRNSEDDAKVTVGYGQERQAGFWEGHVSKGVSDKRLVRAATATTKAVYEKAFDYGVGASVGTHLASTNTKITAGLDHQWGDEMASDEDTAMMTTLSAGVQQYFQGTPHSVGLNVAASRTKGGYDGDGDTETSANLNYNYEFGGGSIYQPDQRYRRVRVEIPGKGRAATYAKKPVYTKKPIYKNQPVYKNQPIYKKEPVYVNKTVRVPTGTMAKSTVELEGQTFFKHNSAILIPSAQQRLRQIAAEIRKHGYKGSIRITGNSCGLADSVRDKALSEQRASVVRNFMIAQGFNAAHLVARGLGASHPKYPTTADQDFKNRRVDIEYVTERQQRVAGGFRNETKRVQNGFRNVVTGYKRIQTGTKNVQVGVRNVQTGTTDILVSQGAPGTPRVIWRTEAIATSPAWVTRALRSNFDHNRSVDTYRTTAGQEDFFGSTSNSAPTANSDSITVSQGKGAYISVLDNDTDAEGSISIHEFGQGTYGSVTQEGDQLVYTANGDYEGNDSFTYTIVDEGGLKSQATVYVTVTASSTSTGNTAPSAVNDMASTTENQDVLINVVANDMDAESDVSIETVSAAGNGSAVIENGQVRYAPNSGYVGVDTFTYTIVDAEGLTDTATVTVTVSGNGSVNTAPVALDDTATTKSGEAVSIHVTDNDSDNESAFSIANFEQGSNGSVVNDNGKLVYTPNANFSGTDSFMYTIVDDGGLTATATVTVTVTKARATNNAPIALDDDASTTANNSVTINVLGNDFDYDEGDLAVLKSHATSSKKGGTIASLNGQLVYTPAAGFIGTDTFTYVIEDKYGLTSTATVTVVVSAGGVVCNTDCTVAHIDDELTSKNTAVTIDVLANDSGTGLNIVEVSQGASGHVTISGNKVVYTPTADFVGNDVFWYKIVDASGYSTSNQVMVYVVDDSKK